MLCFTSFRRFTYILTFALCALMLSVISAQDETPVPRELPDAGLILNEEGVQDGYVLVSMLQSHYALLVSTDGRIVKTWESGYGPALSAYILDDGSLIRAAARPDAPFGPVGINGYMGGYIEIFDWDGNLTSTVEYMTDDIVPHHDIRPMPSGNILVLAHERFTREAAVAMGRDPEILPEDGSLWTETVLEIEPVSGDVVWQWRVWDHLIQDFDESLPNYGVVADHPEKINLNYHDGDTSADWLHANAVAYNAALDQIVISNKNFSEIWIVDHSQDTETTSGEAGDLLYRWGNLEAYNAGTDEEQILFAQHDSYWIPDGYPGAGNIMILDNGAPERPYSRVAEITPPLLEDGTYEMPTDSKTALASLTWSYVADPPEEFYAEYISGAQRQPNGNTLVMSGPYGRIFEVTAEGETVWEYQLPATARAFRAEKYDLSAFADFDTGQDLTNELRFNDPVWSADCQDDTQQLLHPYLANELESMELFIGTYGEAEAEATWQGEACAEHDGLVE
jgi:hypothetical protein